MSLATKTSIRPSWSKSATPRPIPLPTTARMPDGLRDVGESAVAVVAEERVRESLVVVRVAVVVHPPRAAQGLRLRVPDAVVGDEEVEVAVLVVVEEGRRHRPQGAVVGVGVLESRLRGRVLEGSVPLVAVEDVLAQPGHEEVGPAVVVVVGGRDAVVVAVSFQPRLLGDVLELETAQVAVEAVPEGRVRLVEIGHLRAVGEEDVEEPVVVEIEQGDTRDHRLRLVSVGGAARVRDEADPAVLHQIEVDRIEGRGRGLGESRGGGQGQGDRERGEGESGHDARRARHFDAPPIKLPRPGRRRQRGARRARMPAPGGPTCTTPVIPRAPFESAPEESAGACSPPSSRAWLRSAHPPTFASSSSAPRPWCVRYRPSPSWPPVRAPCPSSMAGGVSTSAGPRPAASPSRPGAPPAPRPFASWTPPGASSSRRPSRSRRAPRSRTRAAA